MAAHEAPGTTRAGVELYRAVDRDAADSRHALACSGKLTILVLAVGRMMSNSGGLVDGMVREVAEDVNSVRLPGTAGRGPTERCGWRRNGAPGREPAWR